VTFAVNCLDAKHFFAAVIDVGERAIPGCVLDGSAANILNELRRTALCQRVVSAVYCALSLLRQVAEKKPSAVADRCRRTRAPGWSLCWETPSRSDRDL
jgi:hypothetical protein